MPVVLTDDADGRLGPGAVAVYHHHLRTLPRECQGRRAADAVTAPGDQCNLAGEIHFVLRPMTRVDYHRQAPLSEPSPPLRRGAEGTQWPCLDGTGRTTGLAPVRRDSSPKPNVLDRERSLRRSRRGPEGHAECPSLAHRAISLLRNNYGGLRVKRTSTRGAIFLGAASLASRATICSGNTGT